MWMSALPACHMCAGTSSSEGGSLLQLCDCVLGKPGSSARATMTHLLAIISCFKNCTVIILSFVCLISMHVCTHSTAHVCQWTTLCQFFLPVFLGEICQATLLAHEFPETL
uniref:Uncharacterized protein n=1 Tax=Mus musculus TaxID=10090 RepID=Q3UJT4_MOUSE|nr:unnamed protein product [Mus musculus]